MVTVNKKIALNTGTATFELMGLSTDTKPTGTFSGYNVGVNSVYLELDTGKLYYFKGSEWEEMSMSGGGAGLPAVTSEDNGKVLGVVNGQWDKMEIGGEYETVAEIEVGTMTEQGGLYRFVAENVSAPELDETETYYLNNGDVPSNLVDAGTEKIILFNVDDPESMSPIDPNEPAVGIGWDAGECTIVSDSDAFSNATVKILKKVSIFDNALSDTSKNAVQNKVVTAALAAAGDVDLFATFGGTLAAPTLTMTSTAAEIIAAAIAFRNGKTVKLRSNISNSDALFNGFQFYCHHAVTDADNEALLGLFGVYTDPNNDVFNYLNVYVSVYHETIGAVINISTPNVVSP